jgi:translation initiation factor IF-2
MEQRPLRLGDILDDYCPRERRVTNHAVVAMIEETVKQTRCSTCDTEHVYKGGRAPRRKKPETTGALYKEVLAGITDDGVTSGTASAAAPAPGENLEGTGQLAGTGQPAAVAIAAHAGTDQDAATPDEPQPDVPQIDEGPVHRPLIRAQLARPEGIKIERQAPEFTIRQNNGRGNGSFRGGSGGGDMRARSGAGGGGRTGGGSNNGHRFGRGPRPAGGGGGRGGGPNQGFGRGPSGGGQPRGPRKRSR